MAAALLQALQVRGDAFLDHEPRSSHKKLMKEFQNFNVSERETSEPPRKDMKLHNIVHKVYTLQLGIVSFWYGIQ